jgi:molybdopterin synthase sulfur carrier subunit
MRWRLFATLAEAAGDTAVEAAPANGHAGDDLTVRAALDGLLAEYPTLEDEVLDDDGDLAEHVRLLVNGSDPRAGGDGLAATVEPDAELALFPPVSGG